MQTKNKKYIKSVLLIFLIGVMGSSVFFTSCKDDDDDGSNATELLSYGPMPIQRGAELRFIGQNLNAVTSVKLPVGIEISKSEFTEHTANSIKLIVPQTAEEGYVELIYPDGSIVTMTPIGFEEPISMDAFSPMLIKPGNELTLTGDYLNRVGEIIFTDRIVVDSTSFISQSRKEIKILVPEEAQTGKIALSNGAEDPIIIYSTSELGVVLPVITTIAPNPVKAGTDLVISGTDLDLVKTIVFGGNKEVSEFTAQSATEITVSVPMDAQDGIISLIQASQVAVLSSDDLVMIDPTVSVSPTTVKNGASITVTGTNLDVISKVTFGGGAEGVIEAGGTETEIKVTVPDAALSGEVVFTTTSEKTVSGGELAIVAPVISGFTPASSKPNTDVVITGTNFDIVSKVVFTGGLEGAIVSQSETEITVTIPVGAETGTLTLVAVNGIEVMTATDLEVLQNLPNFESFSEGRAEPGKIITLNGTKMDLIKELIFPDNITATAYGAKSDTKVEVYVPLDVALGYGNIRMITYEGEEGILPEIYFGGTDPVINEAYVFFDFNNTGAKDSWWGNAINSGILDDPANSSDGSSFWNIDGMSGDGWYDGLFFRNGNNNFVTDGIDVSKDVCKFDVNVREAIYEGRLQVKLGDYSYYWTPWDGNAAGYKTVGWVTVEIPLSEFVDGSGNSIPNAVDGGKEFGMIWSWGNSIKINMGIDNIRFEVK